MGRTVFQEVSRKRIWDWQKRWRSGYAVQLLQGPDLLQVRISEVHRVHLVPYRTFVRPKGRSMGGGLPRLRQVLARTQRCSGKRYL